MTQTTNESNTDIVGSTSPSISDDNYNDKYIGQVKWFGGDKRLDKRKSYGFISVITGDMKGEDVFVHQSSIRPCHSTFRSLKRGEYVHFDIRDGKDDRKYADNVSGLFGHPLMIDILNNPQFDRQSRMQGEEGYNQFLD